MPSLCFLKTITCSDGTGPMEEQNFVNIFNILQRFEWFYPVHKYSSISITCSDGFDW